MFICRLNNQMCMMQLHFLLVTIFIVFEKEFCLQGKQLY
jgi:hypothetical protein